MHEKNRIISNYIRLLVTFISGFLIVRMLAEIGPSTLTVYLLLVAGTGFAFALKVVMQESVVPILGQTFNDKNRSRFNRIYWVTNILAAAAGLFARLVFGVLWLLRESFDFGSLGSSTFGMALFFGAIRTVGGSFATPPAHAVLISGKFIAFNFYLSLERLSDLVAVTIVLFMLGEFSEELQARTFFALSAFLYLVVQCGIARFAYRSDKDFAPKPAVLNSADVRWVAGIFGWNIVLVVAFLIYLRLSTISVNMVYGEGPTLILGLVFLLIGYQRQVAMGLVVGLDAVAARLMTESPRSTDVTKTNADIVLRSSYLQGVFGFASVILLWVYADKIFELWLGASLSQSAFDVNQAANLFRVMSIGILARSLSENWMKILGGLGKVDLYARWIAFGSAVYFMLLLIWFSSGASAEAVMLSMAWAYSILFFVVHVVAIPAELVRQTGISKLRLFGFTFPARHPTTDGLRTLTCRVTTTTILSAWIPQPVPRCMSTVPAALKMPVV